MLNFFGLHLQEQNVNIFLNKKKIPAWPPYTLSPCAIESYPTPGDRRGSSSPSHSISGVSSHVADGGTIRIPLESAAIFVLVFLSFSLHSFSRASCHPPSLLLSPSAQSSLMQSLSPLTPVDPFQFDVLDDRYVCLSLHPRYSQYSSPTPQLESVDLPSLTCSHCPSLSSI